MLAMFIPLVFLLSVAHQNGVCAQMHVSVTTFDPPSAPGSPNTFIATGSQIGSSFLASDTPALLYGMISSNDVNAVCQHIVNTGNMNISATVQVAYPSGQNGHTSTVNVQVTAMTGCLAATDGSGTESLITISDDRQAAVLCPNDAGSTGCGVYYMGEDVNTIYVEGNNFASSTSRKLLDCVQGTVKGSIIATGVGALGVAQCAGFGPFIPLCLAGWFATCAAVGAAAGCAAGSVTPHCFPGDATVLLANGEVKHMAGLELGEKVAVRTQDGRVAYEDIYAFGHKDVSASGYYIQLSMKPIAGGGNLSDPAFESELEGRTLELSHLHFAQVSSGPEVKTLYKRAQDIKVGDMMWVQLSNPKALTSPYKVTGISSIVKQGLYNPFTMSGTIIVNGVAASTHSDWFLDNTFDLLGLTNRLPSAYQTILSPVRTLYYVLGKEVYITLYHHLDILRNVADFGTKYGEILVWFLTASTFSIFAATILQLSKSS